MATNAVIRKRVEEVQTQAKVDREWWDRKRETTRTEFMKELSIDVDEVANKGSDKGTGTSTPATVSRPLPAGLEKGSDEDTVLVEGGGPTTPGGTVGKANAKKRKGKK